MACNSGCDVLDTHVHFGQQNVFGYPEREWLSYASGADMMETMDDVEFRTRLRGMRLMIRDESKEAINELAEDLLLIEQSRAEVRSMRARLEEVNGNRWLDYDDH